MRSQGWGPLDGISPLIKTSTTGFSFLILHTQRKGQVRTQQGGSCLQARKRPLPRNGPSWHSDARLPASTLGENKCLRLPVYCINIRVVAAWADWYALFLQLLYIVLPPSVNLACPTSNFVLLDDALLCLVRKEHEEWCPSAVLRSIPCGVLWPEPFIGCISGKAGTFLRLSPERGWMYQVGWNSHFSISYPVAQTVLENEVCMDRQEETEPSTLQWISSLWIGETWKPQILPALSSPSSTTFNTQELGLAFNWLWHANDFSFSSCALFRFTECPYFSLLQLVIIQDFSPMCQIQCVSKMCSYDILAFRL